MIDGPSKDDKLAVPRQSININKLLLTELVVPGITSSMRTGNVKRHWEKQKVEDTYNDSNWAKKRLQQERRSALSDFDRFVAMRLRKQRRQEERKALAKVKSSA
jgi:large subunit ribosomal protein L14e